MTWIQEIVKQQQQKWLNVFNGLNNNILFRKKQKLSKCTAWKDIVVSEKHQRQSYTMMFFSGVFKNLSRIIISMHLYHSEAWGKMCHCVGSLWAAGIGDTSLWTIMILWFHRQAPVLKKTLLIIVEVKELKK